MKDVIFQETWQTRLFGTLFASFGAIALFLAVVGLYGVVSFSTGQRTQEIGVRMALGAAPGRVVMLVIRQGLYRPESQRLGVIRPDDVEAQGIPSVLDGAARTGLVQ